MEQPAEVLTRGRVRLHSIGDDDLATVPRGVNEASAHLRPWMPWAQGAYDRATAAEFVADCRRTWASGDGYCYAITDGGADGIAEGRALVGVCAMERRADPDLLEIGYWPHPADAGRGLVTEPVAALVDQAFALPGIDRVQIWHDAANTASARIPRRLGFGQIARRTPPRDPLTPGELGIDVVWELARP